MEPPMQRHKSLARFVTFAENQSALAAIQDLLRNFREGKLQHSPSPLYLHGPAGTGKSHLVTGLAQEAAASGGLNILMASGSDFRELAPRQLMPTQARGHDSALDKKKTAKPEAAP